MGRQEDRAQDAQERDRNRMTTGELKVTALQEIDVFVIDSYDTEHAKKFLEGLNLKRYVIVRGNSPQNNAALRVIREIGSPRVEEPDHGISLLEEKQFANFAMRVSIEGYLVKVLGRYENVEAIVILTIKSKDLNELISRQSDPRSGGRGHVKMTRGGAFSPA